MKRAAVLLVTLLSGCDLYWSNPGDDVPPVCTQNGYGAAAPAYYDYRDPSTGVCNYYDGGSGYGGCDSYDSNGCCVYAPEPIAQPQPYGSTCDGPCAGLGEDSCINTFGCHAAYTDSGVTDSAGNTTNQFLGCWDIQPLTPIEGGACDYLDSVTCAQHDDCISILAGSTYGSGYGSDPYGNSFVQCAAETPVVKPPDACTNVDCGTGNHCESECYPCDPSYPGDTCMSACGPVCVPDETCNTVDCGPGFSCAITCDPSVSVCYPACYPTGPTDPGDCEGAITCTDTAPACPADTVPGIENGCYTQFCIPLTDCGPKDPGSCDASGATCGLAAPACPADSVPGVKNGCWSGYCIPAALCPVPACETLTTEDACIGRPDCMPVYDGTGCTCDANGVCVCDSQSFGRCETWDTSGSGGGSGVTPPPTPVKN